MVAVVAADAAVLLPVCSKSECRCVGCGLVVTVVIVVFKVSLQEVRVLLVVQCRCPCYSYEHQSALSQGRVSCIRSYRCCCFNCYCRWCC